MELLTVEGASIKPPFALIAIVVAFVSANVGPLEILLDVPCNFLGAKILYPSNFFSAASSRLKLKDDRPAVLNSGVISPLSFSAGVNSRL